MLDADRLAKHRLGARVDKRRKSRRVVRIGAMLGVVEGVGDRLLDRNRHGFGGRVGRVAAMDGDGFNFHVLLRF